MIFIYYEKLSTLFFIEEDDNEDNYNSSTTSVINEFPYKQYHSF